MTLNLSDALKDIFTPDRVLAAAASLGEGEAGVSRAISGIVPAIIGGIISKTGSGIDGASSILNMAKGAAGTGILANLGNRFGDLQNNDFVTNGLDTARRLLGDKLGTITSSVSRFAGIRESSVSSLLAITAPAALGIIGKHATDANLTPASLSNMLAAQKNAVAGSLPVGLGSLGNWITGQTTPVKSPKSVSSQVVRHTSPPVSTLETRKAPPPKGNWFRPVLIGLLILLLLIYTVRNCKKSKTVSTALNDALIFTIKVNAETCPGFGNLRLRWTTIPNRKSFHRTPGQPIGLPAGSSFACWERSMPLPF